MKKNALIKRTAVIALAVAVAFVSYYVIYGWYDIFPWAVVALVVGYTSKTRRHALINGVLFGYVLFLVYILLGYKPGHDTSGTFNFILFDMAFSLVGAAAGASGAFIGHWFRGKFRPGV